MGFIWRSSFAHGKPSSGVSNSARNMRTVLFSVVLTNDTRFFKTKANGLKIRVVVSIFRDYGQVRTFSSLSEE